MPNWLQFLLTFLLLSPGCASVGTSWDVLGPRRSLSKDRPVAPVQQEKVTDEQTAQPDREPLVAGNWSRKNRSHTPADLMLIESELKDASPEERERWMAFLEGVDHEAIPYVLRARRIQQNEQRQNVPNGAAPPTTPQSAPIQIATHAHDSDQNPGEKQAAFTSQRSQPESDEIEEPPQSSSSEIEPREFPFQSEGAAETANGWPKRLKSIAEWDTGKLWPSWQAAEPSKDSIKDDETRNAEPPTDRWNFARFPLALGHADSENDGNTELAMTESTNSSTAPEEPLPIRPGNDLWEDELLKLIALLEAETSVSSNSEVESTDQLRKLIGLRLLYLIANQPDRAQEAIAGLTPSQQEFWTSLLIALSHELGEDADQAARSGLTLAQLRAASYHLQQTAPLEIRQLTLCNRINGFGSYETFPVNAFEPAQSVLLYCEIRNFGSEPTVDGDYKTVIGSNVEIYKGGATGKLVDRHDFEPTEDRCRSIRSDYFHSYRLDLPSHLTSGTYLLKLTILDESTGKTTSESIPFSIE